MVKLLAVAAAVVGAGRVLAGHTPPVWLRRVRPGGSPAPHHPKATAGQRSKKMLIAPHKR